MFKKIILILKVFFSAKKKFQKPKKNKIILYKYEGLELLNKYVKENIIVLDPFREIYLIVLIKSLLNFSFQNILINYNRTFISMTNPKFVFSYIDNDVKFYYLKNFFKHIVFISIQNGHRGGFIDRKKKILLGHTMEQFNTTTTKNKKLRCDYIFTFNKGISKKFEKFIKAKTVVIGSYKNNMVKQKICKAKKTLSFISQAGHGFSSKAFFENERVKITWKDYLSAEEKIIPFLGEYCKKNNLKFQIIPKTNRSCEYEFYKNLIQNKFKWTYPIKKNIFHSYELVDNSNFLVGEGSTLTYEALSRKKKIAFIAIRKEILTKKGFDLDFTQYNFGWPYKFNKNGPFWTHSTSIDEFERVINFVTNVSDHNWLKIINNFNKDFRIPYDKNNSKFVNFLKNSKIKIKESKIRV